MATRRMEKNAWHIAKLLVDMNDGAQILNEPIKAFLLEDEKGQLFFDIDNHAALLYCIPWVG